MYTFSQLHTTSRLQITHCQLAGLARKDDDTSVIGLDYVHSPHTQRNTQRHAAPRALDLGSRVRRLGGGGRRRRGLGRTGARAGGRLAVGGAGQVGGEGGGHGGAGGGLASEGESRGLGAELDVRGGVGLVRVEDVVEHVDDARPATQFLSHAQRLTRG